MDRLKSIFVTSAILFWFGTSVWAIIQGVSHQQWHEGLLLSASLPLAFFASLFIYKRPRTARDFKWILLLIVSGVSWEFLVMNTHETSPVSLVFSTGNLFFWLAYIHWYSVFPNRKIGILEKGKLLPSLSFIGQDGQRVSNTDFTDKKLIYLFYRGNWCPLCMAQIKEVSAQYKELNELGAEVLLISPQPHHFTIKLAKKMDVPFWFLQDKDGVVAKQLGLFVKSGTPLGMEVLGFDSDTVLPTVIITDETGKIIYSDQTDNYRVRPEPDAFLAVLNGEMDV